jgi:hypothetical protein
VNLKEALEFRKVLQASRNLIVVEYCHLRQDLRRYGICSLLLRKNGSCSIHIVLPSEVQETPITKGNVCISSRVDSSGFLVVPGS